MRRIVFFVAVLAMASCKNEPKEFVTFSGKISNQNSDSIQITDRSSYSKTITVNEDGTFKDTLKVEKGRYFLFDGVEYAYLFLENGFDLYMTLDAKKFDQSIGFSGIGSEHSNFLADEIRLNDELIDLDKLVVMDSAEVEAELTSIGSQIKSFYAAHDQVDSSIVNAGPKNIESTIASLEGYINRKQDVKEKLPRGTVSPEFTDYENINGETTSLSDLKGKYVYLDIWATWCGPCKVQFPYLRDLEEKYRDRNIVFVSISVDDPKRNGSWENSRAKWKKMVAEENLKGIQLFAPEGPESEFIEAYYRIGIPRFILLDPEGKIVTAVAPRPSSDELIKLFDAENI